MSKALCCSSFLHLLCAPSESGLCFGGRELDTAAGKLLAQLEESKVASDTLVFLTGDNGPPEDQCDWGGSKGVRLLAK